MRTGAPPSIESSFRSSPAGWRRRAAAGRRRRDTGGRQDAAQQPRAEDDARRGDRGCPDEDEDELQGAEARDPPRPRAAARGRSTATSASARAVVASPGFPLEHGPERLEDVGRALGAGDAEIADRHVRQRERVAREPGDRGRGEHPDRGVERAAPRLRHDLHRERQQREQADGREQRPGAEHEPRPRLPPADREPGEREDAVDERGGLRDVPEREDGREERDRETEPRGAERGGPGGERDEREQRGRPERQKRAADERRDRGEPGGREAARERDGGRGPADARRGPGAAGRRAAGRRAAGLAALRGPGDVRLAQLGCEPRGGRALRGVDGERGVDGGESRRGRSGRRAAERRRAEVDRGRDLRERDAPEGVLPASASQSITPTAQTSLARSPRRPRAARARCTRASRARRRRRSACRPRRTGRGRSRARGSRAPSLSSTSTFDGFTSRCTIPRRWACASASSIWAATSTASRSPSPPVRSVSRSVRPRTYSYAM